MHNDLHEKNTLYYSFRLLETLTQEPPMSIKATTSQPLDIQKAPDVSSIQQERNRLVEVTKEAFSKFEDYLGVEENLWEEMHSWGDQVVDNWTHVSSEYSKIAAKVKEAVQTHDATVAYWSQTEPSSCESEVEYEIVAGNEEIFPTLLVEQARKMKVLGEMIEIGMRYLQLIRANG